MKVRFLPAAELGFIKELAYYRLRKGEGGFGSEIRSRS